MTRGRRLAIAALALAGRAALAQDTTVVMHHLLPLDIGRVRPFDRTYVMLVHAGDSTPTVIGERRVSLTASTYASAPAWLLVESRTGQVPAVESLFVAPDLRPLHWMSALGAARLGAEFVGDSIYGAVTALGGKQNLVLLGRPDLVVSAPMLDALLPLLPLTPSWSDSVAVLGIDASASHIVTAELAVVGEENVAVDSSDVRAAWVIALRAGPSPLLLWLDKASGAPLRSRQPLAAHVGRELEERLVPAVDTVTGTPP